MKEAGIKILIEGCKKNDAPSQKALFMHMYDYGMSIANRYGTSLQDAEEICNDAFCKVFRHINKFKPLTPFKLWVRRIIINTAIDHYRKNKKKTGASQNFTATTVNNKGAEKLDQEYLLHLLNQLSPQYKMVFILFAIEGFSHEEISKQLKITKGTSKSNLSKARQNLKTLIAQLEIKEQYG